MKTKIRRLLFIVPLAALFATALIVLTPHKSAAAANIFFSYNDKSYMSIDGPIGDPPSKDHISTYTRLSSNIKSPIFYNANFGGCTSTIVVNKLGSNAGTWHYGCTTFGQEKTTGIEVAAPGSGGGGGGGGGAPKVNYIGKWIDHSVIQVGDETFVDDKIDDNLTFKAKNGDACTSKDTIDSFHYGGADNRNATSTVRLRLYRVPGNGNNTCVESTYSLGFDGSTKGNYDFYFAWQDAGTISTTDENSIIFLVSNDASVYRDDGSGGAADSNCQSQITVDIVGGTTGQLILRTGGDRHLHEGWPDKISGANLTDNGQGCKESKPITVGLADPQGTDGLYAHQRDAGSSDVGSNGGGGGGTAPSLSCHAGLNPLNWLLCAAVNGMVNIANGLENVIDSLLSVGTPGNNGSDPNQIFCSTGTVRQAKQACNAYHAAWNSFRVLALGLMLVAGLVVIIAQALGMEVLDAYTIRKVLPRLLAAAVLLTLSWQLMQFFVEFTNALGYGIRWLIYSPFHSFQSASINLGGGGGVVVDILGFGAFAALGIFGLLSFAGTAALALFIAFIVLVIRQLLLIVLIVFAPIAIVAYILPNTKKVFDLWWDFFAKALLMFPIITAFIAAGRVFAVVATQNTSATNGSNPAGVDTLNQFLAFAAYFAPYFLLPLTFRLAGGALGSIGGFVNDRGRGGFDRLRKFRQGQTAKNWESMKAGKRWQGNPVADRLSHTLQTGTLLGQAGYNPARMADRIRSARSARTSALSAEAEKSVAARAVMGNDDLLAASVHGNRTEADARAYLYGLGQRGQELEQNIASIRQAKRDMGTPAFEDFAAANNAGTGTGYKSGPAEMLDTINKVAGSDRARAARILAAARGAAERAKRVDLYGAGFATSADQLSQLYNSATTGATEDSVNEKMTDEALNTKSAGELASGRNNALQNMIGTVDTRTGVVTPGAVMRRLARAELARTTAKSGGNPVEIAAAEHQYKRVLAHTASLLDIAGSVSPENAQVIGERVMGMGAGGQTVSKEIERLRTDNEFQQYRREYNTNSGYIAGTAGAATTTTTPPAAPSDRRLKTNIKYLETLNNGIKLYSFNYVWGGPTYVGVMAQDLLISHPEAVTEYSNGYYAVRYEMLGLKLMKLETQAQPKESIAISGN